MLPIILIEGEFRSLMRNALERFIGKKMKRKVDNKYVKMAYKLSIRVISSLIAIYIFNMMKENKSIGEIKEYASYLFIAIFFYILLTKPGKN